MHGTHTYVPSFVRILNIFHKETNKIMNNYGFAFIFRFIEMLEAGILEKLNPGNSVEANDMIMTFHNN